MPTKQHDKRSAESRLDLNRRELLTATAAAGAARLGFHPTAVSAEEAGPARTCASGFQPLEVDSPMARWKKPQPLDFVEAATERFSFPNWHSGNDDSMFYSLNIPSFFKTRVVASTDEFSLLERSIQADLLDLIFTAHHGTTTPPLRDYLVGRRQVQAMMMAHKGKVVFETYPGMNPTDYHVWMSAAKTTAGLLVSMLANEGNIDLDQPVPLYVPELAGSAWEDIKIRNTMNMAVALA